MARFRWLSAVLFGAMVAFGLIAGDAAEIRYKYDVLGRIVQVDNLSTLRRITYVYDSVGNRTHSSSAGLAAFEISAPTPNTVDEQNTIDFTVTKLGSPAGDVTVDYATVDGTATAAGGDFAARSGTLTFLAGETSKLITISALGDANETEGNETFSVSLSNPSDDAIIASESAEATIIDGPAPPPDVEFAISDANISEGGVLNFIVTKTGAHSQNVTVNYATVNNTAAAPADYTAKSGILTFTPTQTAQAVSVTTNSDAACEGSEQMFVDLSGPSAGSIIDSRGVGAISQVNPIPSFSVNNAWARESKPITFTVTKSGGACLSHSVNVATQNNGASAGSDYVAVNNTLTFTPTQTSQTVSVTTNIDELAEGNEGLKLNLTNPTGGATISDGVGDGTVLDAAVIKVTNATAAEGGNLNFQITRTGNMTGTVRVDYATANGSAVAPGDYASKSGTRYLSEGETFEAIAVATSTDTAVEITETMYLDVTFAGGPGVIVDGRGDGSITNVNAAPTANNDSWGNKELFDTFGVQVLSNDTDPENDTLTIEPLSGIPSGLFVTRVSGNTALSIESVSTGGYSFTYTISDGNGNTDTATVSGVIDPQNCPGGQVIC